MGYICHMNLCSPLTSQRQTLLINHGILLGLFWLEMTAQLKQKGVCCTATGVAQKAREGAAGSREALGPPGNLIRSPSPPRFSSRWLDVCWHYFLRQGSWWLAAGSTKVTSFLFPNLEERLRACPSSSNLKISGKVSDWPAGVMYSVGGLDVGYQDWQPTESQSREGAILLMKREREAGQTPVMKV